MGMGLAICRSIVEAYGGRLTGVDNQESGTMIRCVLPAADAEGV
jgi:signal transduction histidine kinase